MVPAGQAHSPSGSRIIPPLHSDVVGVRGFSVGAIVTHEELALLPSSSTVLSVDTIAQFVKRSVVLRGIRAVTRKVRLSPAESAKSSAVLQLNGMSVGCVEHGNGGEIDAMLIAGAPERPSVIEIAPLWSERPVLLIVMSNGQSIPGAQLAGPVFSTLSIDGSG